MIIASIALLSAVVMLALLFVRDRDLPKPAPISPFHHLDERKASIYENLRDLQFEYRVGKLSDHDYQQTKLDLQKELAKVLAEVDRLKAELHLAPTAGAKVASKPAKLAEPAPAPVLGNGKRIVVATVCVNCGAEFSESLKFCGECGAPINAVRSEA